MIQLPEFPTETISIRDLVVLILCTMSALSAKQIFGKVRRQGTCCSYQAVYKQLFLLGESGVVRKEKRLYSLDPVWIKRVESIISEIKEHQTNEETSTLPVSHSFNCLRPNLLLNDAF